MGGRGVDAIFLAKVFALLRAILGGGENQDVSGGLAPKVAPRTYFRCVPCPMPLCALIRRYPTVAHYPSLQLVTVGPRLCCSLSLHGEVLAYGAGGRWEPLPRMAEAGRCFFGLCAMGDGVAVVGGGQSLDSRAFLRSVEQYSWSAGRWRPLPDMGQPRLGAGAAVWRGRLVVAGGAAQHCCLNSVEAYDPAAGEWRPMPPMVCARVFPVIVVYGDRLMAIGGKSSGAHGVHLVDTVEQYDPDAGAWRRVYSVAGDSSAVAVPLPRRLCVGGEGPEEAGSGSAP